MTKCGVPQGLCLGPLLFTLYWSKLFVIIGEYTPCVHAYADDTQLHLSFKPGPPPNKSPGNEVDSLPPDDSWDSFPVFTTTREISAVLLAESRDISASIGIPRYVNSLLFPWCKFCSLPS